MFSLEHGVNLSRRACRLCVVVLLVAVGVGHCGPKPPNHAADTLMHSQPDHDNLPVDLNMLHQEGATPKYEEDVGLDETTTIEAVTTEETITQKPVQRYPVASVSFHRVETPFIIGMWIFCASLAKIGRWCGNCTIWRFCSQRNVNNCKVCVKDAASRAANKSDSIT